VGQGAGSRDPVLTGCGSERVNKPLTAIWSAKMTYIARRLFSDSVRCGYGNAMHPPSIVLAL
jgi:hypothetical protein